MTAPGKSALAAGGAPATMSPAMSHHRPAALLLAIVLPLAAALLPGCGAARSADHELTAEEQVLMARLTRDPFVIIESWQRDDDGYVVVTTTQGSATSRYVFKPDRPGERALNIHHIEDVSRLDSPDPGQRGTGPQPNRTGRNR
jgi:hypothetical protein